MWNFWDRPKIFEKNNSIFGQKIAHIFARQFHNCEPIFVKIFFLVSTGPGGILWKWNFWNTHKFFEKINSIFGQKTAHIFARQFHNCEPIFVKTFFLVSTGPGGILWKWNFWDTPKFLKKLIQFLAKNCTHFSSPFPQLWTDFPRTFFSWSGFRHLSSTRFSCKLISNFV